MSFSRSNAGKRIPSYQQKTDEKKQPHPLSNTPDGQDEPPADTKEGDKIIKNLPTTKAKDDEAALRWQELRAARTEEEEIERYKVLQTRRRTKAEAQHDEDLHNLRMRRMRERKTSRTIELRAAQASDTARRCISEIQQQGSQARDESMGGSSSVHEETEPSPPQRSEISNSNEQTSWVPPSLKRTDSTPMTEPSLETGTRWRDIQRCRGQLSLDFSRIDTHYILSHDFIIDVNTMLDFISGWPESQIHDVKYAFQTDWINEGRVIEFVDLDGKGRWGVRILNPLNTSRRDSIMYCPFASSDSPFGHCQSFGRDQGCPNKLSMEERIADLKNFREQRTLLTPPLPPRSAKRRTPRDLPRVVDPLPHSVTPAPHEPTLQLPDSPRPSFGSLPDLKLEPEQIEDIGRSAQNLRRQLDQVKTSVAQFGVRSQDMQDQQASGRSVVREWLQKSNIISIASKHKVKPSLLDSAEFGPIGGRLTHKEKIPTGPNSLRRTDLFFSSRVDSSRVNALGPLAEDIRTKPRDDYYAATYTTVEDGLKSEDDIPDSTALPRIPEQSAIDRGVQSELSSCTSKTGCRPGYFKDPVAC